MPNDEVGRMAWENQTLTDESREAFYRATLDLQASQRATVKSRGRLAMAFGFGGMGVGFLAVVALLDVFHRTPVPPPPGYIFVDREMGSFSDAVPAKDVPKSYPATVIEKALRDYIVACESYVPETWARSDFHTCMIMSSPAEQKRRQEDIGKAGTRYPPDVFGKGGWAFPTAFPKITRGNDTGSEAVEYEVRYERTEILNNRESRPRWTAHMVVTFHPELKMTPADRLLNPAGLQTISFSTTKD